VNIWMMVLIVLMFITLYALQVWASAWRAREDMRERAAILAHFYELAKQPPIIMGAQEPPQEGLRDPVREYYEDMAGASDLDYVEALEEAERQTSSVDDVEGSDAPS